MGYQHLHGYQHHPVYKHLRSTRRGTGLYGTVRRRVHVHTEFLNIVNYHMTINLRLRHDTMHCVTFLMRYANMVSQGTARLSQTPVTPDLVLEPTRSLYSAGLVCLLSLVLTSRNTTCVGFRGLLYSSGLAPLSQKRNICCISHYTEDF